MQRRSALKWLGGAAAALTMPRVYAQSKTMTKDLGHLTPKQRADYEAMHDRMMKALPYERVETTGAEALAEWERLRRVGRGWPIIVGDDEQLERIAETFSIDDPAVFPSPIHGPPPRRPAEILDVAARLRFPEDLRRWDGYGDPPSPPLGDWPTESEQTGLTVARDVLTGKPFDRVHILLIPARESWEVPAYLRWGGWNGCTAAEYHVAALHHWAASNGAELIGISGDTMNLRVARRPTGRPDALALAREQYLYCTDIIDQGVGSLSALAASLVNDDWWYFWWD